MAQSLSELRKSRGKFDNLMQEVEKISNNGSNNNNEGFWQPTVDKANNGSAIIRFLPAPKGEELPWVRVWSHAFKGPTGKWYIQNSLTTIGQNDPIGEHNQKLWNTGLEADKQTVRNQKRKLTYYANILVVADPGNPSNEGKVFLYKFGTKIFDKIKDAMNPEFDDEVAINPFDFWEGANFKLKIREVEGYRNYDKSEFAKPSAIAEDDDDIDAIWSQAKSLQAFVAPDKFKSYEELTRLFQSVMGNTTTTKAKAPVDEEEDLGTIEYEAPDEKPVAKKAPAKKSEPDSDADYFASLADD
jgi:hypothetical protein